MPGATIEQAPPQQSAESQDRAERVAILGRLAGGILHEFNNILTVVTGTIDILALAAVDRPELGAVVRLIEDAAVRGSRLTSLFQAFERGRPAQGRSVDVDVLLSDAVRLLRPVLGNQIEVASPVVAGAPMAVADASLLLVAILGLADAARNVMTEGGMISLGARSGKRGAGEAPRDERVVVTLDAISHASIDDFARRIVRGLGMVEAWIGQSGGSIRVGRHTNRNAAIEIRLPKAAADAAWLAPD